MTTKPIILKVLTAGEGGVGKTTLLRRYVDGIFMADTRMTIGVEFFLKELTIEEKKITLQLWDFGGQERFRFLLESYAAGAKGAARYEQQIPSRYGFLEEEIANRTKDIEQRKDANINQALMQAGLGIMGSRSPYFMRAVSEGGLSALGAYRQGLKDIQEGEKDLLQSKATLANAQTLYDQGKYAAAEREKEDALKLHDRGIARKETENAMLAQITKNNIDEYNARIAGAKLPYEQKLLAAHAQLYGTQSLGKQPDTTASPAEANAAHELATKQVFNEFFAGQHKDAPATPEFNQRVNNKMQQILLESGKPYKFQTINQVPDVKPPVVRGDPNSPLRLP